MPRSTQTSRVISKITGELAVTAIDLAILAAGLAGGFLIGGPGAHHSRPESLKVPFRIMELIYREWDKTKFRRAIGRAMGDGLLKRVANGFALTEKGKKRLSDLLPSYKTRRAWDGRLWLVTYDIPDNRKRSRDQFRVFLREIGCGMVQESVWLSIKDPKEWLAGEMKTLRIRGNVIISCMGKDGNIGEERLQNMIARVFQLKRLAVRYAHWVEHAPKQSDDRKMSYGLSFLTILKEDPVLPKALLPIDWMGDRARDIFEKDFLPSMGVIDRYLL